MIMSSLDPGRSRSRAYTLPQIGRSIRRSGRRNSMVTAAVPGKEKWRDGPNLFPVGKWGIWRVDSRNLVLTDNVHESDQDRFYPHFPAAVEALLRIRLEENLRKKPEFYLESVEKTRQELKAAIEECHKTAAWKELSGLAKKVRPGTPLDGTLEGTEIVEDDVLGSEGDDYGEGDDVGSV